MPFRSFRAATGVALPCLIHRHGVTDFIADGDEIEVDFDSGVVEHACQASMSVAANCALTTRR